MINLLGKRSEQSEDPRKGTRCHDIAAYLNSEPFERRNKSVHHMLKQLGSKCVGSMSNANTPTDN